MKLSLPSFINGLFVKLIFLATLWFVVVPFGLIYLTKRFHEYLHLDSTTFLVTQVHMYSVVMFAACVSMYIVMRIPMVRRYKAVSSGSFSRDDAKDEYRTNKFVIVLLLLSLIVSTLFYCMSYVKVDAENVTYKNAIFSTKTYALDDMDSVWIEGDVKRRVKTGEYLHFLYELSFDDGSFVIPFHEDDLKKNHHDIIMLDIILQNKGIMMDGYFTEEFLEDVQEKPYFDEELKFWLGI